MNSHRYAERIGSLNARLLPLRPTRSMSEMLPLRNKARKHISACSRETTKNFGWTVLPHPPCSPDIARSYCHLIGGFKISARRPLCQTRGTHCRTPYSSGYVGGRVTLPGVRLSTKETTLNFTVPSAKHFEIFPCPTFKEQEVKVTYVISWQPVLCYGNNYILLFSC